MHPENNLTLPYAVIIEDDPKLSMIYQIALEHAGFRTALDINGNKYHSLLDSAKPALIVLDIHLPFASGVDILNEIRDKYSDTIIAVTTADIFKAKTLQGKADHVLIKPVSVASLLKIAEAAKG
jgi:DNA-binding response OmpR family regulator